jgi:hypothetical protein
MEKDSQIGFGYVNVEGLVELFPYKLEIKKDLGVGR